jgi:uncharacterized protein with FMN-binding domain
MTILFVVLGVVLLGILIYIFIPKAKAINQNHSYIPGKYKSSVMLGKTSADIEVVIKNNKIASIGFLGLDETQKEFYPLVQTTMANMSKQIVKTQSLEMEFTEDTMTTGNLLLTAVKDALAQAQDK